MKCELCLILAACSIAAEARAFSETNRRSFLGQAPLAPAVAAGVQAFDTNLDGVITYDEYLRYFVSLSGKDAPPAKNDIKAMFAKMDFNEDGMVDSKEFTEFSPPGSARRMPSGIPVGIIKQFNAIDKDGNGIINYGEYRKYLVDLGDAAFPPPEADTKKNFAKMDFNGDDKVEPVEFHDTQVKMDEENKKRPEPVREEKGPQSKMAQMKIDTDLDGKISYVEWRKFSIGLNGQGPPPAEEMMKKTYMDMDTSGDGWIDEAEFKNYVPPAPKPVLPAGVNPAMPGAAPGFGVAPPPLAMPVAAAVRPGGLKCVGWRRTTSCVPSGPRDPLQDRDCFTLVSSEQSGYCECEGYVHTAAVPCGHAPVNCTMECGMLQKLHTEKFGSGGSGNGPAAVKNPCATPQGAGDKAARSKDPYGQALNAAQKAVVDVHQAVENSNKLLGGARNMISKMMNLKPWAEIAKMGKDTQEAGEKAKILAKLARPYIYVQEEAK